MVKIKSSQFITAILSLLLIMAITWISCNKGEGTLRRCEGVICENGGYCYFDTVTDKPRCICPTGYEGPTCASSVVTKYLGTWDMRQIITGSDSAGHIRDTSYYTVLLRKTATNTTFFIDNFSNNKYYNQILCSIDSANSYNFGIDTISAYHMLFDNFKLLYGYGYMTYGDSFVVGTFALRHLTSTSNWVYDTVDFKLSQRRN